VSTLTGVASISPAPPHEPEIELLRRAARLGLVVIRAAFWLAGALAVYTGLFGPPRWTGIEWPATHLFVFACIGVPLLLPTSWWLGRRWRWALAAGCLMWLLPMFAADEHRYGLLLRVFASAVACASMVVWRTLWRLTTAAPVSAGSPSP
jgi:hypothetical protein